MRFCCSLTQYF